MILGLDIATCTGFAYGDGSALPTVGHIQLPAAQDGDRGDLFSTFRKWLLRTLAEVQPTMVMFEQPIMPKPFIKDGRVMFPSKIDTTLILQGLVAILEVECYDRGIPCKYTTVGEVKKQLTGKGKAEKADMVRAAKRAGLRITVDDEADAFGVWLVGVRYYAKQHLHRFDQLLWGRGAPLA